MGVVWLADRDVPNVGGSNAWNTDGAYHHPGLAGIGFCLLHWTPSPLGPLLLCMSMVA